MLKSACISYSFVSVVEQAGVFDVFLICGGNIHVLCNSELLCSFEPVELIMP